jgi:hypothetical protein
MMQTHFEPHNIEVLLELAEVGAMKELSIRGKLK